ncbi:universal stress protein [Pseudonocardia sp. RS11V-5]|uniref:universal stress protein n=1 Tax=Pseudonocardia terrae TaxID=2905831 RepID=UPI001E4A190A|nr:universal stress protein [Pseudonocardia terrae]MCE3552916.1 universal stress protein [Pseudonocardia terrae]
MIPTLSDPGGVPGRREEHDPQTGFHPRDQHDALRPDAPPETLTTPAPATPVGALVVGLDGSPQSRAALRWAVAEARARNVVVDVVLLAEDRDGWLDEVLGDTGDGVEIRTVDERGDPATVLLGHATAARLLVLGHVGGRLDDVTRRCTEHARCPVVLVPVAGR